MTVSYQTHDRWCGCLPFLYIFSKSACSSICWPTWRTPIRYRHTQHIPSELHTIYCVSEKDSILNVMWFHNKKKRIERQTCATRTTNCDCRDLRARRLWITLVRSRQSMQLLLNVPSCCIWTVPSESTRKYLFKKHTWSSSRQEVSRKTNMHERHHPNAHHTRTHPASQPPYPPGSAGDATSCDCTPYGSQTLYTCGRRRAWDRRRVFTSVLWGSHHLTWSYRYPDCSPSLRRPALMVSLNPSDWSGH